MLSSPALQEITLERVPLQWAATQTNLGSAGDMLDLIEEGLRRDRQRPPVSKAAVFREFMVSLDPEDDMPVRNAEAALAFLVEQGMVELAGDTITVPASFWSDGQVPAPAPTLQNFLRRPAATQVRPIVNSSLRHSALSWGTIPRI